MNIKKWAGTKLGFGAPPGAVPGAPGAPPPAASPPPPMGTYGAGMGMPGMYGPPSVPLFNPGITSSSLPPTMAQWAQAGGTAPEHPGGPPPWADDPAALQHAEALVKKNWEAYDEPWAVVAYAYDCMKDAGNAAAPPGAPPGGAPGAPKPPMPPGPPKPPGGPPGAKPGFPPKSGGMPKPPGM